MRTLTLLCAMGATLQGAVGVRVILGLTDRAETKWDGSVSAQGARITGVEGWRLDGGDEVTGTSWRASTHRIRLFGAAGRGTPPFTANGVVVWLDGESESAALSFQTAQGDFSVKLADIPYGKRAMALDGRAMADRIPPTTQLTKSNDEQDYPAAAVDKSGAVWVAYVEFRHNKDHHEIRANYNEKPDNFDDMQAPTGGDHIVLTKLGGGSPVNVTEPGGDVYRPAVAVDGNGRVWVFWSQNEKGNFDLYARAVDNGKPGAPIRVTNANGSDVFPGATTDSSGRVWVAWQGWRDGRARIFAASQAGAKIGAPVEISQSTANEWNPSIAADASGRVTAVWDSYRNGSYDVYLRTNVDGKWTAETPVAATANYEAYPSAAYDKSGKLWLAYEEGGPGWGKDWGAYETSGLSLYQARAIRLIALDAGGARFVPEASFDRAMPGIPEQRIDTTATQADPADFLKLNPEAWKQRRPSGTPLMQRGPKNTMPRLTVDVSGRVWLAFRSSHPIWWNPLGTVWSEYVTSCSGGECTGPVFLMHTDNLLDNRPAVVSAAAGKLTVVNSSDGRRKFIGPGGRGRQGRRQTVEDPYQNELWTHELNFGAGSAVQLHAAAAPGAPWKDSADAREIAQRQRIAIQRIQNLKIVRGEFHRHSEISGDGGGDGSIIDQWRYMLDPGHMDWVGCCDHDNGGGREYSWWTTQKLTDIFHSPGKFVPMFSYERSVSYPEGHRNVVFAQRGIRPLPRLPRSDENTPGKAPDTQMFYDYLRKFNGVAAVHTSGTNMGTDWRDNDPVAEPIVEIYQGDRQNYEKPGAPRTNAAEDSIGGWRPKGFVSLALEMGYKLGFQASSDHISTHMSYCNLLAKDNTREAILEAFQKRHIYGATDDIFADVRSGEHIMGDVFETSAPPDLQVRLVGTAPFAKVYIVRNNEYVYTAEPKKTEVTFRWRDASPVKGKQSYYYVRGEQEDGEVVWVSPMWITYK